MVRFVHDVVHGNGNLQIVNGASAEYKHNQKDNEGGNTMGPACRGKAPDAQPALAETRNQSGSSAAPNGSKPAPTSDSPALASRSPMTCHI